MPFLPTPALFLEEESMEEKPSAKYAHLYTGNGTGLQEQLTALEYRIDLLEKKIVRYSETMKRITDLFSDADRVEESW